VLAASPLFFFSHDHTKFLLSRCRYRTPFLRRAERFSSGFFFFSVTPNAGRAILFLQVPSLFASQIHDFLLGHGRLSSLCNQRFFFVDFRTCSKPVQTSQSSDGFGPSTLIFSWLKHISLFPPLQTRPLACRRTQRACSHPPLLLFCFFFWDDLRFRNRKFLTSIAPE